jgi:flagellar hook assembly protein FlgD
MKPLSTVTYTYADFDSGDSYDTSTGALVFTPKTTLGAATYTLRLESTSSIGEVVTMEGTGLIVNPSSTNQTVSGTPLNYPNPFKPSTQSTTVSYTLAVDGTTSLYIFDMHGKLIWKRDYASGSMGGKAGYNEVTWDGRDDFSTQVGNGIYPFRIVSNGKVIGKGKIAVIE